MKNNVSISWWLGIISFLTRRTGVRSVWVLSFAACFSTVSAAPIDSCRICVLYKYYIILPQKIVSIRMLRTPC